MEALAILIVVVGFFGMLFGALNVVVPIRRLRITKRLHGLLIIAGSAVVIILGAMLGVTFQPGGWTAAAEKSRADQAAREAAAANAPTVRPASAPAPTARSTPAAAPATAPARREGLQQGEFSTFWLTITARMQPCDNRWAAAGEALATGDAYTSYDALKLAKDSCSDANSAISQIDIPRSATRDQRRALDHILDACSTAAFVKYQAMDKSLKVVDGDNRPSAVSAARNDLLAAQSYQARCVIAVVGFAHDAGLVVPGMEPAPAAKAG